MSNKNITFVTGLWDIGRDNAGEGFKRSFDGHYIEQFKKLLALDINLIIFCEHKTAEIVWQHRKKENTLVIERELESFKKSFDFFNKVQEIRSKDSWKNQAGWLQNSPQATLEYYNPIVMSKFFMLHDSCIFNPFQTEHFYWIDAGISSTVNLGYFTHDKVHEKLTSFVKDLLFVCFPYSGQVEVHGFDKKELNKYCGWKSEYVARGGFFGGKSSVIKQLNGVYYNLLKETLENGLMGTEESVFTIMCYKYPTQVTKAMIESNGLINTFFENIKNNKLNNLPKNVINYDNIIDKLKLYILTFNSPEQLHMVIENFKSEYPALLNLPEKVIINNSNTDEFDEAYQKIADEFNFTVKKFNNIGICGARQWVSDDFVDSSCDYYIFFEDDMFFNVNYSVCKSGFPTKTKNILEKSIRILEKENLDYLKLTFSEFFGDNSRQWAYCNIPEKVRLENFGDLGLTFPKDYDKIPKTKIYEIGVSEGLPYAIGEFYYCNWPIIFSKQGNLKVFQATKWAYPYEQTWMSHVYQEQIINKIRAGCLLFSPITHNRVHFYKAQDRKEN